MSHSPTTALSGVAPERWRDLRAVLFDLDGVLTPTAEVHQAAWRETFVGFFAAIGRDDALSGDDYLRLVDGKPRYDGVASVLDDRGLSLPLGTPEDAPGWDTVCAIGNVKNRAFTTILERDGVAPYPGSVAFLDAVVDAGLEVAVVSSSRNAPAVLRAAGLSHRFSLVLDGEAAARRSLPGKPAPDTYLAAAAELGWLPSQCAVVEDALSGVASGAAGGFGLVLGVARDQPRQALLDAGATAAVDDLGDIDLDLSGAPEDAWSLTTAGEAAPTEEDATVYSLGNGFVGLRWQGPGAVAPGEGTFVNGLHETWPITYPENSYGQAEAGQSMIAAPDARAFRLYVDEEALELGRTEVDHSHTRLDFRDGTLTSHVVWRTAQGSRVEVRVRQLVSFEERHLAVLDYQVRPLDSRATIHLVSGVAAPHGGDQVPTPEESDAATAPIDDPRKSDAVATDALQPVRSRAGEGTYTLGFRVKDSGMTLGVGTAHVVRFPEGASERGEVTHSNGEGAYTSVNVDLEPGEALRVSKYVTYHSSRRQPVEEMIERAQRSVGTALSLGYDRIVTAQQGWAERFWDRSDVVLSPTQPGLQRAVRWNLWQLAQAAARADGLGISAKGVSGNGYSGHYFWDTEVFVVPFLNYTTPQWARNALRARVTMLPKARERARVLNEEGALFAWRTINGDEASAYFPAGTAQYHINADISSAVFHYLMATKDRGFLTRGGAQILVETARLWMSLGFWRSNAAGRAFHLHGVTGPDEYTALVNDNLYTNVSAAFNLEVAAKALALLEREEPAAHAALVAELGILPGEPEAWLGAAQGMHIGFDESLGVHAQDADFLDKEVWDVPGTPREKHPLLLHFHPLVLYRFQVLKQADSVLALWLHSSRFTAGQKRADFEYYDPLTTGDSTLSATVQSIVAAEVGYAELALEYFEHALHVDLDNLHGNTSDGVHVASTGGVWAALVNGFGGLRDDQGSWSFDPRLPASWPSLSFCLTWRGTRVRFTLTAESLEASIADPGEGAPVSFEVRGTEYSLTQENPMLRVELDGQGPVLPGRPSFEHVTTLQRRDGSRLGPEHGPEHTAGSPAAGDLPDDD
ncbi:HAD-IA family hydrolase [Galactobacter valiniphilus]|uniref:HAD-IA family hydrolase n=1 Tax=Galactobacter valiniphilus TaxID=2676122 RepID=UPI001F1A3F2E|nr:HAD-IA family hydrolase [Galactobacter valiniphilus]